LKDDKQILAISIGQVVAQKTLSFSVDVDRSRFGKATDGGTMSATLGRISARLAEPSEETISPDLIDLINSNINPPNPLKADEVIIRAMYVVSDEVNSFGGRFPIEEHARLVELLVDSPVMVGHRKDKLPIGRNFHAVEVEEEEKRWVKTYFYWLVSAEGAESLRENIDGGIYKECSIGFTYLMPECSICAKDLRNCEHQPLQQYNLEGETKTCHFNYRKIERVLETSLVYRGAVQDTSISKELKSSTDSELAAGGEPIPLENLSRLDNDQRYLVTPYYDGIPVVVSIDKTGLTIRRVGGDYLKSSVQSLFQCRLLAGIDAVYGLLIGYRGKERCSLDRLEKYLDQSSGPVARLELKLLAGDQFDPAGLDGPHKHHRIRPLRSRVVEPGEIEGVVRSLATRDGVRLWPVNNGPLQHPGYRYCPRETSRTASEIEDFEVGLHPDNGVALMSFGCHGERLRFQIRQFNVERLGRGSRFVADRVDGTPSGENRRTLTGRTVASAAVNGGYRFSFDGDLRGSFVLRPIRLDGRRRWLFYRVTGVGNSD
jgi:hypothetical protein